MNALAFLDARILTICSYVWVHEWRERCEYAHGYTLVMLPPTSSLQWKYCRDEKPWHNKHQFPPTSWVVASYNRYVWNQFVVYFVLKSMTHQTQVFAKEKGSGGSSLRSTKPDRHSPGKIGNVGRLRSFCLWNLCRVLQEFYTASPDNNPYHPCIVYLRLYGKCRLNIYINTIHGSYGKVYPTHPTLNQGARHES